MNEEAFKAACTGGSERLNIVFVVTHDAAPTRPVDGALPACGSALLLQSGDGAGCRQAVERHVHQHRIAARGRGSRGGEKTFPVGASWIIDVHVRIHQARQDGRVAEIIKLNAVGDLRNGNHRANHACINQNGARLDRGWQNQALRHESFYWHPRKSPGAIVALRRIARGFAQRGALHCSPAGGLNVCPALQDCAAPAYAPQRARPWPAFAWCGCCRR